MVKRRAFHSEIRFYSVEEQNNKSAYEVVWIVDRGLGWRGVWAKLESGDVIINIQVKIILDPSFFFFFFFFLS